MSSHHVEVAAVTLSSGSSYGATGVPFTLSSASSYAATGVASNVIENNTVCSTALIQRASWEPHRTTIAILIDTGSEEYENSRQCQAARRMLGKSHEGKEFPIVCLAQR